MKSEFSAHWTADLLPHFWAILISFWASERPISSINLFNLLFEASASLLTIVATIFANLALRTFITHFTVRSMMARSTLPRTLNHTPLRMALCLMEANSLQENTEHTFAFSFLIHGDLLIKITQPSEIVLDICAKTLKTNFFWTLLWRSLSYRSIDSIITVLPWSLVSFGNRLADVVFFYIFRLWYGRFRGCVVYRILGEYTLFWIPSLLLCVRLDSGSFFRRSRRLSGKN